MPRKTAPVSAGPCPLNERLHPYCCIGEGIGVGRASVSASSIFANPVNSTTTIYNIINTILLFKNLK